MTSLKMTIKIKHRLTIDQ